MSRSLFALLLASAVLVAGRAMPKMPKLPKFKVPRMHKITVQQGNSVIEYRHRFAGDPRENPMLCGCPLFPGSLGHRRRVLG